MDVHSRKWCYLINAAFLSWKRSIISKDFVTAVLKNTQSGTDNIDKYFYHNSLHVRLCYKCVPPEKTAKPTFFKSDQYPSDGILGHVRHIHPIRTVGGQRPRQVFPSENEVKSIVQLEDAKHTYVKPNSMQMCFLKAQE